MSHIDDMVSGYKRVEAAQKAAISSAGKVESDTLAARYDPKRAKMELRSSQVDAERKQIEREI